MTGDIDFAIFVIARYTFLCYNDEKYGNKDYMAIKDSTRMQ